MAASTSAGNVDAADADSTAAARRETETRRRRAEERGSSPKNHLMTRGDAIIVTERWLPVCGVCY